MTNRAEEILKSNEPIISKDFLFCLIPSSLIDLFPAVLGHACMKLLHAAITSKKRKNKDKKHPQDS